jgi:hypothetical protein
MSAISLQLKVPDVWQQEAIRALQAGRDVVVAAPTGAGKTYIFELLIENGFTGQAVYTVPTRALANDKLLEWQAHQWNVGITTGDRADNTAAPVVVATLETRKWQLLRGEGPALLVIDEYQMLGDRERGVNYELAIACAPARTRLLLLSGSVGNAAAVAAWLQQLGRNVQLVESHERPVPLEEVQIDALPDRLPEMIRGFWPRAIGRALNAGMAPLLAFAPRRRAAEDLAFELARNLPEDDPLLLTPEQQRLAGAGLARLLRARIAYHHSGLDYRQRAGLIEPLAKAGQLRVVVATMGLAAGINFSMRSVLVTDRAYRSGDHTHLVRPDELLQMFGRAGRRGLDKIGFILTCPGKPRLNEARPLQLRRCERTDWPSLLAVMDHAARAGRDPARAARALCDRLFSGAPVRLGLADFRRSGPAPSGADGALLRQTATEIQNPDEQWERRRAPQACVLGEAWIFDRDRWLPALAHPGCLADVAFGTLCRLPTAAGLRYGRELPVARFGRDSREGELVLTRGIVQALKSAQESLPRKQRRDLRRTGWTLDALERRVLPQLELSSRGGRVHDLKVRNDTLYARFAYDTAMVQAWVDGAGRALVNPPEREVVHETDLSVWKPAASAPEPRAMSAAEAWYRLGLIDTTGRPTRRGRIFSFFNHGEGFAIATALEDSSYPVTELILHLANLRAGHRFANHEAASGRLGMTCRAASREASYPGILRRGLPEAYGDGAAEVLFFSQGRMPRGGADDLELRPGDIERARLEWRSLLHHIAASPPIEWDRWLALRQEALRQLDSLPAPASFSSCPPLTAAQRKRHKSFLRF